MTVYGCALAVQQEAQKWSCLHLLECGEEWVAQKPDGAWFAEVCIRENPLLLELKPESPCHDVMVMMGIATVFPVHTCVLSERL